MAATSGPDYTTPTPIVRPGLSSKACALLSGCCSRALTTTALSLSGVNSGPRSYFARSCLYAHRLAGGHRSCTISQAKIHFSSRPIAFSLDSSETPQRHAPETMAGGVAVFDYDHDGNSDIFFTNGADIAD